MFESDSVPYFPLKLRQTQVGWTCFNPLTGKDLDLNGAAVYLLSSCNGYSTFEEILDTTSSGFQTGRESVSDLAVPLLEKFTDDGVLWWRKRRMNFWRLPPPIAVLWDITGKCNLHCRHCVVESDIYRNEGLPHEECLRLVDEMADFGVQQLILSGGEPTLRSDLLELCSRAVERGLSIQLATNATTTGPELAVRLAELGVMAQVSLDSPRPELHDEFRQSPGAWQRSLTGIKHLLATGVKVTLAATITTSNIADIPELYRLAAELGVTTFRILPFVPGGRGADSPNLEVSPGEMRKLTLNLRQIQEEVGLPIAPMEFECTMAPPGVPANPDEQHIGCDGAIAYCTITSEGDVLPCNFFPGMDVENVMEHSFEWIWNNSRFLNYFRSLVTGDIEGCCQSCDWLGTCRGSCIAANFAHRNIFQSNCHCWLVEHNGQLAAASGMIP